MWGGSRYNKVMLVFCDTGLEYPEIKHHVRDYTEWLKAKFPSLEIELVVLHPKLNFHNVLTRYGYPIIGKEVASAVHEARTTPNGYKAQKLHGTLVDNDGNKNAFCVDKYEYLLDADFLINGACCNVMKKRPAAKYEKDTGNYSIIGTMADESRLRMTRWMRTGCNAFDGARKKSAPMSFWNEQDVLRFIVDNSIPIASVYGRIVSSDGENDYENCLIETKLHCTGCNRTGCIFCGFGAHLEKGKNRYQRLKETHPKQWKYCINGGEYDPADGMWKPNQKGLGFAHVLDFIGVPYE